jgi:2-methylcitrate dehydratase PrpD
MPTLTESIAQFVAAPDFANHLTKVREIATTGFIDTMGTMMAGATEPVVNVLLKHYEQASGEGLVPVPFAAVSKPASVAACINGTAAHALDYDDVALSGHPSTVLVPAILAQGHVLNSSGQEALDAYVVGYEVWAELIGREPGKYHLKGWHPTGVMGTVACAAALSYLNRFDAPMSARAMAIAASMASGLVANFGTMTKPFHAGRAASNAIEAVQLAKLGLTAAPDVFEHHAGLLQALSIAGDVDTQSHADQLGQVPRILEYGLSVKRYPVCYSCHRAIDGALALIAEHDLEPHQVATVTVTMGPAQASMLRNHRPQTALQAKFSIEFAVASALVAREVGLRQLTDDFVQQQQVQSQFPKIQTAINQEPCPLEPAFALTDRVQMQLVSGEVLDSGDIRFPLGNALNPMTTEALKAKFMDCVDTGVRSGARLTVAGENLYERLKRLAAMPSVRDLFVD